MRSSAVRSLACAAAIFLLAAPAAQAALPRGQISKVVRVDGRRVKVTLSSHVSTPVVSAYLGDEHGGESTVVVTGGDTELYVALDMLDNDPIPEGLTAERARLQLVTPDASGRRTWNPTLQPGAGAAAADLQFTQALDGPAWSTGARVDARVRLVYEGEVIIVELGRFRLGGDFTLAQP